MKKSNKLRSPSLHVNSVKHTTVVSNNRKPFLQLEAKDNSNHENDARINWPSILCVVHVVENVEKPHNRHNYMCKLDNTSAPAPVSFPEPMCLLVSKKKPVDSDIIIIDRFGAEGASLNQLRIAAVSSFGFAGLFVLIN